MNNTLLITILWIACVPSGYRISVRHRALRGVTPWGLPSFVWALICLATGPLGLLVEYFAGATTRPAPAPQTGVGGPSAAHPAPVEFSRGVEPPAIDVDLAPPNPAARLLPPKGPDGGTADFGWYADVLHRHDYRYFDGKYWSDEVADAGVISTDPIS